jgi:hypothetical protein
MKPNDQSSVMQMNLQLSKSEPMRLPQDKQRELAMALADLLLNAAIGEPAQVEKGDRR